MKSIIFENAWYNMLDKCKPDIQDYITLLQVARIEFPKKEDIQDYYANQIRELSKSMLDSGFPLSLNLNYLYQKTISEYKKSENQVLLSSQTLLSRDELNLLHSLSEILTVCQKIKDEIYVLQTSIEIIGFHLPEINIALDSFFSRCQKIKSTINVINSNFISDNYILSCKKDSWIDTLLSIDKRICDEVRELNTHRTPCEINSLQIFDDLALKITTETKYFDLSSFLNLINEIVIEVKKEFNDINIDNYSSELLDVITFLNNQNLPSIVLLLLKRDALIESSNIRLNITKSNPSFEENIKDLDKLNKVISHLIEDGIVTKEQSGYKWNGIRNNKVESLMDFSRVLEEEKIVKHIGSFKDIFVVYNSFFNTNLKDGVRQAQEVYAPHNEIRFRAEFSFIKSIH